MAIAKLTTKQQGPSGFIEIGKQLLVVDYGQIYLDGTPLGFLFEDGIAVGDV